MFSRAAIVSLRNRQISGVFLARAKIESMNYSVNNHLAKPFIGSHQTKSVIFANLSDRFAVNLNYNAKQIDFDQVRIH
jgi:hypothetical protein